MTANTYRILIGAHGWLHTAWQGGFYPDDLPEDWQLGYYSNEFPVVLMPAAYWQHPDTEIAVWLEDSASGLCLICEAPVELLQLPGSEAVQAINRFIQRTSLVGERCIGVSLLISGAVPALDSVLAQIERCVPLVIDVAADISMDELKAVQKVCEQQGVGLCWHGQGPTTGLHYGPLAMTRINGQGKSMRQLREVVETILKQSMSGHTNVLIIDGQPPDIEAIRHTGVILELF